MTDSHDGDAPAATADEASADRRDPAKSPAPDVGEAAKSAAPSASSDRDVSAAPSPFLFADAARLYPKQAAPVPPPADTSDSSTPEADQAPEIAPPPYVPPPVIEFDVQLAPPRRLTVPPSPIGPPPRPSVHSAIAPARVKTHKLLIAVGSLVLVGGIGFTLVIVNRWEPPHSQTPSSGAGIDPPTPSLESSLAPSLSLLANETQDSDGGANAAAGARPAHRRREGGSSPGAATAAAARAQAAARRDPTMAATPSPEQVSMAAHSIRGPVLMCGMSLPANSPDNCEVTVSFDSSGHVVSAAVGAPFAGTSFGSCVASAARRMTVPPFSNATFRATQSLRTH